MSDEKENPEHTIEATYERRKSISQALEYELSLVQAKLTEADEQVAAWTAKAAEHEEKFETLKMTEAEAELTEWESTQLNLEFEKDELESLVKAVKDLTPNEEELNA
jgi:hypothetical protein